MKISDQLTLLSELGRMDQKLKDARDKFKLIPLEADKAKVVLEDLQAAEKKLADKHQDLLTLRRKLDGDLQAEKSHLRKWETRAEQIRGEREYTALMSEIGSQKKAISDIETQMLEKMQMLEDTEKELAKIRAQKDQAQSTADAEWAKVKDNVAETEAEIEEENQIRLGVMQKLPVPLIKRYEQIAKARAGQAIAFVQKEVCQACRRTVPAELALRVMKGELIEQCPACQRILVTENYTYADVQKEAV